MLYLCIENVQIKFLIPIFKQIFKSILLFYKCCFVYESALDLHKPPVFEYYLEVWSAEGTQPGDSTRSHTQDQWRMLGVNCGRPTHTRPSASLVISIVFGMEIFFCHTFWKKAKHSNIYKCVSFVLFFSLTSSTLQFHSHVSERYANTSNEVISATVHAEQNPTVVSVVLKMIWNAFSLPVTRL